MHGVLLTTAVAAAPPNTHVHHRERERNYGWKTVDSFTFLPMVEQVFFLIVFIYLKKRKRVCKHE